MKLLIPILLLCLTATGQPPMPVSANHARPHKRPLASPKSLSVQPASIMRKGAAHAVSGPMTTNYVRLGYDVSGEPSMDAPYVAFYSSSNMLDWRYIGRMEEIIGSNQVFATTSTVPAMYYKANVIVRPVFFTNVTVSDSLLTP